MTKFRSIFKKDAAEVERKEVGVRENQAKLHIDMYISNIQLDVIAKERELESLEDKFVHGDKNVLRQILFARADLKFLREAPQEAEEYKKELFSEQRKTADKP